MSINHDFLSQCSVQELANICYFSNVSNKYVDYCAENKGFEFKYSSPVRVEFLNTLDSQDKEFFIELILSDSKAIDKAYDWLIDYDYELQEVA